MAESTDLELRRMGDSAAMTDDELSRTIRIAQDLAKSEMFKAEPSKSVTPHQAFAKILIGRDLGISPTQALMGIDIVRGNIQMRATLLASFVRKSLDYGYRVLEHDEQHCKIEFTFADGSPPSLSEFSMAEADRAGLTKPSRNGEPSNYVKYPKNMLWARAMSNGVKWYCPDLLGGIPVYTEADTFEGTASEIGSGHGDGSEPGWGDMPTNVIEAIERIIERAQSLGHAGLSDRATAQMSLSGQPESVVAMWIARARVELDEFEQRKQGAVTIDAETLCGEPDPTRPTVRCERQRGHDGPHLAAEQTWDRFVPDPATAREQLNALLDLIIAKEEAGADETVMAGLYAEQERLERALGDEPGEGQEEMPL